MDADFQQSSSVMACGSTAPVLVNAMSRFHRLGRGNVRGVTRKETSPPPALACSLNVNLTVPLGVLFFVIRSGDYRLIPEHELDYLILKEESAS